MVSTVLRVSIFGRRQHSADMSSDGKTLLGANGSNLANDNATPHDIDQTFDASHSTIELVGVLRGDVNGSCMAPG